VQGHGAADSMRIKVTRGVQVVHDGKVYADGASADVPDAVARFWVRSGRVTELARSKAKG